MATKLYVGNLSFRTTSEELKEAFSAVGTVESASVIEDRETGRSRGFAFVEMSTPEEAAAAIEQFNGKDFGGRNLTVNEAKPRTDRGDDGRPGQAHCEPMLNTSRPPGARERCGTPRARRNAGTQDSRFHPRAKSTSHPSRLLLSMPRSDDAPGGQACRAHAHRPSTR